MKKLLIFMTLVLSMAFSESSYYSQNGIGLTSDLLSVRGQGLGNTGGAILDSIGLSATNPAFWYNFETTSLQGFVKYSTQTSGKLQEGFRTSDLGGFALKFPVGDYIGVAFGLKPQYRTDYITNNLDSVAFDGEQIKFYTESEYSGGISEAFLGLGYKIGSRLSIGIKSKLLFGNYDYTNTTDKDDDGYYNSIMSEKLEMRGLQSEFGLGWNQPGNFTVGFSYTLPNLFSYKESINYYYGPDSDGKKEKLTLPEKYSCSIQKKLLKQLYFTSDFYYLRNYSDFVEKVSFFKNIASDDSYFIGFGLERVHENKFNKNYWKNLDYRMGLFYKTEPFFKQNEMIRDIGFSLGMGIPMNMDLSVVDLSFQYINRSGFLEDEIGKESIYKISLGITTGGLWFRKF
ncbi:MAG: hypothetical protein JXQ65_11955 [Candidatus Marinimicrobia bacterium]|nr:hypothetical protein [Candidatus Neomarinimicrobiota bacterium]